MTRTCTKRRDDCRENQNRYRIKHRDKIHEYAKRYRDEHRAESREYQKQYRLEHREKIKAKYQASYLHKKYGVSKTWLESAVSAQGGCAICKIKNPTRDGLGRQWHVDHDHESGKVRGVLCINCNLGLGHFKDSPVSLRLAIEYLLKKVKLP